jgi:hypothetical protein
VVGRVLKRFLALEQIIAATTRVGSVFPQPSSPTTPKRPQTGANGQVNWRTALVAPDAQDIVHTASRRAEPRAWLRMLDWLLGAGIHPKAGPTTRALAQDLAKRMDYTRGIVLYDLQGTARRLDVSVATVKRHVAILRELGALVWLVHGSKRNLRLPGRKYTATATIYGAVIPRCYDEAMGHRLSGRGYEARVCGFTDRGRELAIDRARSSDCAPHSLTSTTVCPAVVDRGDPKATRRARSSKNPRKSILGKKITASTFATAYRIAKALRPLVNWAHRATLSQLSWVLVDKVLDGWDHSRVHLWLREINPADCYGPRFLPQHPHVYIAHQLRREAARRLQDMQLSAPSPEPSKPNQAFLDVAKGLTTADAAQDGTDCGAAASSHPSDQELQDLRHTAEAAYLTNDSALVTSAVELLGIREAVAVYGLDLVAKTLRLRGGSVSRTEACPAPHEDRACRSRQEVVQVPHHLPLTRR